MIHSSWGFLILSTFVCWLQQNVCQVQIPQELSDWASAPRVTWITLTPPEGLRQRVIQSGEEKKKKKKNIPCFLQKHLVRQANAAFLLLGSDRFAGHPLWISLLLIRLSLFIHGYRYKSIGRNIHTACSSNILHTNPQTNHNKLSANTFNMK